MSSLSFFVEQITLFFAESGRAHLPWRKKGISAYEVWVSEVMLQQTQVSRVIQYYNRFLQKFPTVFDLAKTSWEEFLPYYAGLGYYRRGENMIKTAQKVVELYGGVFPKNKKLLTELPGIGNYTASAILSFAYEEAFFAIDTNLERVFGRFLFGHKTALKNKDTILPTFPKHTNYKILNAGIMDFANSVCLQKPQCHTCPLQKQCTYFKEQGIQEIKEIKNKLAFPTKEAKAFIYLHKNHTEYYSKNPDNFEVFILPPEQNSRDAIKEYFLQHFNLQVSVRPPRKKIFIQEKPVLIIYAQILAGTHSFGVFKKEDIEFL